VSARARTPAGESFTDLVLETFRLNGRLLAAGDGLARGVGLTSARWQVLGALAAGPLPVAGIARRMGLQRQSVQRVVDVLAEEGVLAFEANPTHRRAKLVRTTDEGRRRYARVSEIQKEWANRVSRGLDPAAVRAAAELMREVQARLRRDQPR
jgi:DNA-binding MarR family transcriptional regulator